MARDLREYLAILEKNHPDEILNVKGEVNPAKFDVTAFLTHLENHDKYPLTYFKKCLNLHGEVSQYPFVMNIYASRKRCAVALGLPAELKWLIGVVSQKFYNKCWQIGTVREENDTISEKSNGYSRLCGA